MLPSSNVFHADPKDFVIAVMGPTGSGKSNFINNLTGNVDMRNAGRLRSDTQSVVPHVVQRNGSRIVLVDTPGFDHTYRSDNDILRVIADWLTQKYTCGSTLRVDGIIYLHRITDQRLIGSVHRNLQMFGHICGNTPLPRVRLVTTMWDTERNRAGAEHREAELKREFWKPLLEKGAEAEQFHNTADSAWAIVQSLLGLPEEGELLLLQEELVEQEKRLNETEAGKLLCSRFQRLLVEQKRMLKELKAEVMAQSDPALAKVLQEEYDKVNAQLEKTLGGMKEMKIPLSRRVLLWLFGRKSRARAINID